MINDVLTAVKNAIDTALPELRRCEVHGGRFDLVELKRIATQTPAVFVSLLSTPDVRQKETEEKDIDLIIGIYVITSDKIQLPRHISAINIVETILRLIPINGWGLTKISTTSDINAQNLYTGEIDKHGIAMWAISFKQTLRVGTDIWLDPNGVLPSTVYITGDVTDKYLNEVFGEQSTI